MADTKLSALTELAATPADNDELYIRDEGETPANESKRITVANLLGGVGNGGFTKSVYATDWAATGRHAQGFNGGGSNTFGTEGLILDTSATQTSSCYARFGYLSHVPSDATFWENSLEVGFSMGLGWYGDDFEIFVGIGTPGITGTSITFTNRHIGFTATRASAGAAVINASNSDGTTQTATDVTGSLDIQGNSVVFHAVKDATTNIKFYADGALVATHTTNLPTGTGSVTGCQACINNANVATRSTLYIPALSVYVPYA